MGAHENNRLAEESLDLRGLAEEQGRACTLLAAELVEMVWSLTSNGLMVETLHMSNLSRIAKQALAQATTGSTSKEEQQLAIGLLGCLVNVLSAEHGLGTSNPKTILGIDLMTKVGVAAGRWRVGERGRGRLVEVAANLEATLAGAGAAIKHPPPPQKQQQ